jgi:DNA-directed RNA polymerase subunit RPC12/RpoP
MAVTTVISCPACAKRFKGRPELKGKKVRCPACAHTFLVEDVATDPGATDDEPPPAPKARPPAKPKPAAKPAAPPPALEDEDDDPNPYGVTTADMAPRCPHCANEMESADAIVCLFCGYNTQTRQIGQTKTVVQTTTGEHFMWLLPGLLSGLGIVFLSIFCLFFCLALPDMIQRSWMSFLDHESMRMWITLIALAIMWPAGFFAHKRLIMQPRPPEQKKD